MESEFRNCPHCGEKIKAGAIKCKHCLLMLTEDTTNDGSVSKEKTGSEGTFSESPQKSRLTGDKIQSEGKSFLASLFDLSMKEMVTPKIIRFIFIIGLVATGLGTFAAIVSSLLMIGNTGFVSLIGTLIVSVIGAFIAVIFLRVYLEIIILLFNIYDQLVEIKTSK